MEVAPESQKQAGEKQPWHLWHSKLNNLFLGFIVTIICLALLKFTESFSIPIVASALVAPALYNLAKKLQNLKLPHFKLPYAFSCIIVLLLFYLLALLLVLIISKAGFDSLKNSLSDYETKFKELFDNLPQNIGSIDISQFIKIDMPQFTILDLLPDLLKKGANSTGNFLLSTSKSISGLLSSFIIFFLALLFTLLESEAFGRTITNGSFSKKTKKSIKETYKKSVEEIGRYLLFKTIISMVTGATVGFGLWLLDLDFPFVWGILAFVMNFIPSVGSILHSILVSLFSWLQFGNSYLVLGVIIFLLTVQFVIGNLIEPKIFGEKLKLSPLFILLFLYIWGYIWGLTGMFLAVPILSVLKIFCNNMPSLKAIGELIANDKTSPSEIASSAANAQKP